MPGVGDELVDVVVGVDGDPPVAAGLAVVEVLEVVVLHVQRLGEDLRAVTHIKYVHGRAGFNDPMAQFDVD